jgi:hypothetical protein
LDIYLLKKQKDAVNPQNDDFLQTFKKNAYTLHYYNKDMEAAFAKSIQKALSLLLFFMINHSFWIMIGF